VGQRDEAEMGCGSGSVVEIAIPRNLHSPKAFPLQPFRVGGHPIPG